MHLFIIIQILGFLDLKQLVTIFTGNRWKRVWAPYCIRVREEKPVYKRSKRENGRDGAGGGKKDRYIEIGLL